MVRIRAKGAALRKFILDNIAEHSADISILTSTHFKLTRQAVNKHLKNLVKEGVLEESGNTRNKIYKLMPILEWHHSYQREPQLGEDLVWRNDISPVLGALPSNVTNIWNYAFTEMFNNAIDHSQASNISVHIKKTAVATEMWIVDDGVGIFKKIQTELNLLDERHAVLELAKGKLTTDPSHHSGEGIFFTSRMFDSYGISSGEVYFSHDFGEHEDWIFEQEDFSKGTSVWMKLNNHTSRTSKKIFDDYTSGDNYGFNKTVVPVKLAQYGNDKLISRSQAKRLLSRVELFKVVIFDFKDIDMIGQAFADEIFRVFSKQHPNISLAVTNANVEVKQMITRAKSHDSDIS